MWRRLISDKWFRRGAWSGAVSALAITSPIFVLIVGLAVWWDWMPMWWRIMAWASYPFLILISVGQLVVAEVIARFVHPS